MVAWMTDTKPLSESSWEKKRLQITEDVLRRVSSEHQ